MNKEQLLNYKRKNPYHVWVHLSPSKKFVGHFKDKKDAEHFEKITKGVYIDRKITSAGNTRRKQSVSRRPVDSLDALAGRLRKLHGL